MSTNVVELRYQHVEDGDFYKHQFERDKVEMIARKDGTIVLRHVDGLSLHGDYTA